MSMKKGIRNLVIGEGKFIESYAEYKQVMLSGSFALVAILICSIYLLLDIFAECISTMPIYGTAIFLLTLSIFIHRQGDHCFANYFLLPTINITVYLLASSESLHTGIYIYFIVNTIAAFAVFNYKQRKLSILFTAFSYMLFLAAYFVDFSLLPYRNYSEMMILTSVVLNFSFALAGGLMAVYLLISLNHYNASQLVANNRMLVKTNSELDRFVYSTSHDLRAPLTSVMGLISIAERSDNIVDVKNYMNMMRDRMHSLDKFIKDITDYSRNNRLGIRREKISLADLAAEVWESLKYAPEAEHIQFVIDIPTDVEIESDKTRLRVVISNLIANAVRYHDKRKLDQFIRLGFETNGGVFSIQVEDNGQGIDPEYHTKIFDMFYRANEESKGSGLGLYIVKEALAKLSGSIYLESSPGVGSTFIVRLPN